jgi:hypothetical protein
VEAAWWRGVFLWRSLWRRRIQQDEHEYNGYRARNHQHLPAAGSTIPSPLRGAPHADRETLKKHPGGDSTGPYSSHELTSQSSSARPSNFFMSDISQPPKTSRDGSKADSEAATAESKALIVRPEAEELSVATTTPADTVVAETVSRDTSPPQTSSPQRTQASTPRPTFQSQTWQSWSRTGGDGVVESD